MKVSRFTFSVLCSLIVILNVITKNVVSADRILFLLPIASKSHHHVFEPLMRALGERGHDIVSLSPVKSNGMPSTVKQVQILTVDEIFGDVPSSFASRQAGKLTLFLNNTMGSLITKCGQVLKSSIFQDLLEEKFDLVIADILMSYCTAGAIAIWKAPSIMVTCYPAPAILTNDVGNRFLASFVTDPMSDLPHEKIFFQRLINFIYGLLMYFGPEYGFIRPSEKLYRELLPNGENLPDMHAIQANASLVFSNSHWTLTHPRPLLPDVIEVGGMHTLPAKPLPKDLQTFLDGSGYNGFIYFSLDSIVKGNEMPEEYRQTFIRVFSKLKQRVIWKWDDDNMEDVTTNNILIRKWLPQQDILGHPKIKIFMSHGVLLSTQEAAYHGVPMLALPIWGDQDLNSNRAETAGFAKVFEILSLTDHSLEQAINEMLETPKYMKKAKEISTLFRDQPQTPLQTAVFWSEYVLRHKGAPHIRSFSRQLNFFQYYLIDVILFLCCTILIVLCSLVKLCKCIICRRKRNTSKLKVK